MTCIKFWSVTSPYFLFIYEHLGQCAICCCVVFFQSSTSECEDLRETSWGHVRQLNWLPLETPCPVPSSLMFEVKTVLFSVSTGFNPRCLCCGEVDSSVNDSAAGKNLLNVCFTSYRGTTTTTQQNKGWHQHQVQLLVALSSVRSDCCTQCF